MFSQYWLQVKLDPELSNLNQRQLDALRKMVFRAYNTGRRNAKKGKAT